MGTAPFFLHCVCGRHLQRLECAADSYSSSKACLPVSSCPVDASGVCCVAGAVLLSALITYPHRHGSMQHAAAACCVAAIAVVVGACFALVAVLCSRDVHVGSLSVPGGQGLWVAAGTG